MKKTFFILTAIVFLLAACDLALPQSVTLKTDADYNFVIGDVEKDFNSSFDKSSLFSGLEDSGNAKVYDYNPGQNSDLLQQFILDMEIGSLDSSAFGLSATIPEGNLLEDAELSGTNEIDMDISTIFSSLDVLGDEFADKASFYKIPVFIYCNVESGFTDSKLTKDSKPEIEGAVVFSSTDASVTKKAAFGTDDSVIVQVEKPVLKNAGGQNISDSSVSDLTVVTNVEKCACSLTGDMGEFANACRKTSGKMNVTYNLSFTGTTSGDEIKITIHACLVLPLAFIVDTNDLEGDEKDSPLKIDLIALSKSDEEKSKSDIFNRSEATDISDMEKYLDIIDEVTIYYFTSQSPVNSDGKMKYVLKSRIPYIAKYMLFSSGSLSLNNEEFMDMLKVYPYTPDLYLEIPNNSVIRLPRDISLDMSMSISLSVNGELKF